MAEVTCHLHQNALYYPSNGRRYHHGIPVQQRRVQESSGITKDNKAVGKYDVLVEQLKNIGPKAQAAIPKGYLSYPLCVRRTHSTKEY